MRIAIIALGMVMAFMSASNALTIPSGHVLGPDGNIYEGASPEEIKRILQRGKKVGTHALSIYIVYNDTVTFIPFTDLRGKSKNDRVELIVQSVTDTVLAEQAARLVPEISEEIDEVLEEATEVVEQVTVQVVAVVQTEVVEQVTEQVAQVTEQVAQVAEEVSGEIDRSEIVAQVESDLKNDGGEGQSGYEGGNDGYSEYSMDNGGAGAAEFRMNQDPELYNGG